MLNWGTKKQKDTMKTYLQVWWKTETFSAGDMKNTNINSIFYFKRFPFSLWFLGMKWKRKNGQSHKTPQSRKLLFHPNHHHTQFWEKDGEKRREKKGRKWETGKSITYTASVTQHLPLDLSLFQPALPPETTRGGESKMSDDSYLVDPASSHMLV